MVDYYPNIRGTVDWYVRSCQSLTECRQIRTDPTDCTEAKCCLQEPERCYCHPGNDAFKTDSIPILSCIFYDFPDVILC